MKQGTGMGLLQLVFTAGTTLLVLVFSAACTSHIKVPGVANIASTATTTGSANASPASVGSSVGFAAYAVCMRAHGVRDFPDPNSQGQLSINAHPGSDLDPSSPIFQAANNACKALNPVNNLSPAQQAQIRAKTLKYSQCMRQNGIPDFPDPQPNGALMLPRSQSGDLNQNSPAFQKAQQACKALLPNRNGVPANPTATSSSGN